MRKTLPGRWVVPRVRSATSCTLTQRLADRTGSSIGTGKLIAREQLNRFSSSGLARLAAFCDKAAVGSAQ